MRVPKIVAGSERRRLEGGGVVTEVDVELSEQDACDDGEIVCGDHGECASGECVCDEGWETPPTCESGDCVCSRRVGCAPECAHCGADGRCELCADATPLLSVDGSECVAACPARTNERTPLDRFPHARGLPLPPPFTIPYTRIPSSLSLTEVTDACGVVQVLGAAGGR